jgi:hypothetical protein
VVGQLSSFFRSNLVNELRAQYTRETRPRLANALAPTITNAVGNVGTVSFLPTTQFDWRTQVFNNLTWITGNHSFKFGAEYNHVFVDQTFAFNQFGLFNLNTGDTRTILDILSFTPGFVYPDTIPVANRSVNRFDSPLVQFRRQIGNGQLAFDSDEIAFYAQDSWRIRPNFTLNYGLRYEGQFNPSPDVSNTALLNQVRNFPFPIGYTGVDPSFIPNNTKQFAPRLGFAWDPGNDGKTVIRGFGGIYFARTPSLLLAGPLNNFRIPAGDLSIQLPLSVTSLPVGNPLRTCTTVFCQLNLIGINLNSSSLDSLPAITAEQVQGVAAALGLTNFSPFTGAQPITWAKNYKNPRSYQFGIGVEHQLGDGLTGGIDYSQVNTVHLQRNRELNLGAPILRSTTVDPAQRPFYGGQARPIPTLGSVQLRESSARSVFQSLVFRTQLRRKWGQFNAFYTLSRSLSDDDNERDSGGVSYENNFNLIPEFNYSRLDRRHQFVASPVFFLPYDFEVSSAIRLLSSLPVDARAGADLNGDTVNNDRPYQSAGVPFKRNAFRNRPVYNVDLRMQKGFRFTDKARLTFSAEMFNLFNFDNVQYAGQTTQFCTGAILSDCGFGASARNPLFLQLRNPDGTFITSNNPGAPFQAQFGARFQF